MTRERDITSEFYDTKAVLQRYVDNNEARFVGSERDVTVGMLEEELSRDPKSSQSMYINAESKLTYAEIQYDRGTLTKYGRKAIDIFEFKDKGLFHSVYTANESGDWGRRYKLTQLVDIDEDGEVKFSQGIGEKRQAMALRALEAFRCRYSD